MPRSLLTAALATSTIGFCVMPITPALADGPTVTPGRGWVDTGVYAPGSPGTGEPVVQPVIKRPFNGRPAIRCTYELDGSNRVHDWDLVPGRKAGVNGNNFFRSCSDGSFAAVWVPLGTAAGDPGGPMVRPGQLALEARNRLILAHPTMHRSPTETNGYKGDPFTYAQLATWFWTNEVDYRPQSQTVSVGSVSATVVARPIGLLFDPGDGGEVVRCPGPGRAWTDVDANSFPDSGCGYRYEHVTDGTVTSRLSILWRVTWTGTGGTGGTLPTMETFTDAPLRVLQIQVVNQ